MVDKVNGRVSAGEFLGRNMEFYTVVLDTIDCRSIADGGDAASQAKLDKIVEIVSMNGQPILMGAVGYASTDSTLRFAIEHKDAWADPARAVSAALYLEAELVRLTPDAWGLNQTGTGTAGNVDVTISDTFA